MAPRVTHAKTSTAPAPSDPSLVGGPDWNADHVVSGVQPLDSTLTTLSGKGTVGSGSIALSVDPAFTGIPTAPTASPGTNTTQLATTAFVIAAVGGGGTVSSVFGRSGVVTAQNGDYTVSQVTGAAPLASPSLTGTPTAPTATPGDNSTIIANTAFVTAAVAAGSGAVSSVFGRVGAVTAQSGDYTASQIVSGTLGAAVVLGNGVTATTQAASDYSQKVSTTAFGRSRFTSVGMINGKITASVGSSILTVAIKTLSSGGDPSASEPVTFVFSDNNGGLTAIAVTSALSINTSAIGASLGTANNQAFKLWLTAFNNSGTVVLALFQSLSGGGSPSGIARLLISGTASASAIGAGSTSAGTFYAQSSVTSMPYIPLGYLEWPSGLATAGTYASGPTSIQLYQTGQKLPGDTVQTVYAVKNTYDSTTSTSYQACGPQTGNSISLTSAANIVKITATNTGFATNTVSVAVLAALFRNGTAGTELANCTGAVAITTVASGLIETSISMNGYDKPNTTSSTSYTAAFKNNSGSATIFYGNNASDTAVAGSNILLEEVMT